MKTCAVETCDREAVVDDLCELHYQRHKYGHSPYLLHSDNLRRVPLDDVAVNWLLGVFERLPSRRVQ